MKLLPNNTLIKIALILILIATIAICTAFVYPTLVLTLGGLISLCIGFFTLYWLDDKQPLDDYTRMEAEEELYSLDAPCKCTNCGEYFESDDELETFEDKEVTEVREIEYLKGCPNCETDAHLMAITKQEYNTAVIIN